VNKIVIVLLLIAAALIVGYCYLFEPHMAFEEVRISDKPDQIKAVYVNT
jgi:Tfp pilus assembly protein PilO